MRRLAVTVLVSLLVLSLCACGSTSENPSSTTVGTSATQVSEWERFIADYNDWADDYISIVNQYKANPSDTTILAEYTEMVNQVSEWSTRADALTEELKNSPEDAAKYAAELLKIANKLAEAAQ